MSLSSRRPWSAAWIAHPDASPDEYGVYHFRCVFSLEVLPDSLPVRLSADNRYRLQMNGRLAAEGPAPGSPRCWFYDEIDLADFLVEGKNVLTATVWDFGEDRPWAQLGCRAALILDSGAEDWRSILNSGEGNWTVCEDPAYRPCWKSTNTTRDYKPIGAREFVDASLHPAGLFSGASRVHGAKRPVRIALPGDENCPWKTLHPRRVEPPVRRETYPLSAVRFSGVMEEHGNGWHVPPESTVSLLFDAGRLENAFLRLPLEGGRKSSIRITYAEALFDGNGHKGHRDEVEDRRILGYRDVYLPAGGSAEYRPLTYRTFRFLQIDIVSGTETLELRHPLATPARYPFPPPARFHCDEPSLLRLHQTALHTLELSTWQSFMDCPYYERLQYIGDARIESLCAFIATGETRLWRQALLHFQESHHEAAKIENGVGLLLQRYPTRRGRLMPTFSLLWIEMLRDYWWHTGDVEFASQLLPTVHGILQWFGTRADAGGMMGALEGMVFIDWTEAWQWDTERKGGAGGGEPDGARTGHSSIVTLLWARVLRYAAELSEACGNESAARNWRSQGDRAVDATLRNCWDENRGLVADTPRKGSFSQHANINAVLAGTFDKKSAGEVVDRILDEPEDLITASLYYRFFLHRAVKRAGRQERFFEIIRPWHAKLEEGLTTFPETLLPDSRSDCHGWSSGLLYDFVDIVAGLDIKQPGFAEYAFSPCLGPLGELDCSIPTPRGRIRLRASRKGGRTEVNHERETDTT